MICSLLCSSLSSPPTSPSLTPYIPATLVYLMFLEHTWHTPLLSALHGLFLCSWNALLLDICMVHPLAFFPSLFRCCLLDEAFLDHLPKYQQEVDNFQFLTISNSSCPTLCFFCLFLTLTPPNIPYTYLHIIFTACWQTSSARIEDP